MARGVGLERFGKLFTPEEDALIIELKEKQDLSWGDIAVHFAIHFPHRSKGTLQVRYCRSLSQQSRKKKERVKFGNPDAYSPHDDEISPAVLPLLAQTRSKSNPEKHKRSYKECHSSTDEIVMDNPPPPKKKMRTAGPSKLPSRSGDAVKRVSSTVPPRLVETSRNRRQQPVVQAPQGWVMVDSSDPKIINDPHCPAAFHDPSAGRVIEYNTRSGSYRTRTRCPRDDQREIYEVPTTNEEDDDDDDEEVGTSDTVTDPSSARLSSKMKKLCEQQPVRARRRIVDESKLRKGRCGKVDDSDEDSAQREEDDMDERVSSLANFRDDLSSPED